MKIHSAVPSEDMLDVENQAKNLGLWDIPSQRYVLKKAKAKTSSPRGYPDSFEILVGVPELLGSKTHVSLYASGKGRDYDWFRTSPILACRKIPGGYAIETENSLYLLEIIKK